MLVKVHISQPENWCNSNLRKATTYAVAGMEVEILTETMVPHTGAPEATCTGRHWTVSKKSKAELSQRTGIAYGFFDEITICEHMLEMD